VRRSIHVVIMLCLCWTSALWANPLLLAPTGTTLTTGQFRVEAALSPANKQGKYFWFATGFMQFEASLIRENDVVGENTNIFGAQWCFLPETFITPAVSFGVRDIGLQTKEGMAGYLAVTKHVATEGVVPVLKEFSATLGLGAGGLRGPFAGFEAKFAAGFFVEGEYDTQNLNGAVGWQPISMVRIKAYSIRHDTYFGLELTPNLL
jgi:hypothetical protein